MNPRLNDQRALLLCGAGFALVTAVAWMLVDAAHLRTTSLERTEQSRVMVRLLGTADMALSSSSRWLRHPSLSEPGAPFADAPAILDVDPAGAMIGPPLGVSSGKSDGFIKRRHHQGEVQ